jgi:hypothetical protein
MERPRLKTSLDQWVHLSRVLHEMKDSEAAVAAITVTTDFKCIIQRMIISRTDCLGLWQL